MQAREGEVARKSYRQRTLESIGMLFFFGARSQRQEDRGEKPGEEVRVLAEDLPTLDPFEGDRIARERNYLEQDAHADPARRGLQRSRRRAVSSAQEAKTSVHASMVNW